MIIIYSASNYTISWGYNLQAHLATNTVVQRTPWLKFHTILLLLFFFCFFLIYLLHLFLFYKCLVLWKRFKRSTTQFDVHAHAYLILDLYYIASVEISTRTYIFQGIPVPTNSLNNFCHKGSVLSPKLITILQSTWTGSPGARSAPFWPTSGLVRAAWRSLSERFRSR